MASGGVWRGTVRLASSNELARGLGLAPGARACREGSVVRLELLKGEPRLARRRHGSANIARWPHVRPPPHGASARHLRARGAPGEARGDAGGGESKEEQAGGSEGKQREPG